MARWKNLNKKRRRRVPKLEYQIKCMIAQMEQYRKKHPPTLRDVMADQRVKIEDMSQLVSTGHRPWDVLSLALAKTTYELMRLAEAGRLFWGPPHIRGEVR